MSATCFSVSLCISSLFPTQCCCCLLLVIPVCLLAFLFTSSSPVCICALLPIPSACEFPYTPASLVFLLPVTSVLQELLPAYQPLAPSVVCLGESENRNLGIIYSQPISTIRSSVNLCSPHTYCYPCIPVSSASHCQ